MCGCHIYKKIYSVCVRACVRACVCVCLPLSSFVTLRSMRKLRMAVKMPSAAYPYHSIPHTAPKQHLSFNSHSMDTQMCVKFPED